MTLQDHSFKEVWDSDEDDISYDLFVPALSSATLYQRVAGYFNSTTLAIAARGIKNLLANDGKMQLVCGTQLSQIDKDALEKGKPPTEFNNQFITELNNLEDGDFRKNHAKILAWMIANKKLEIKIAQVDDPSGIYHMKIGIIQDENSTITFSGSVNETANGWMHSAENLDVFTSGKPGHDEYISGHKKIFKKYWSDQGKRTKVFPLPEAIERKLIEYSPLRYEDVESLEEYDRRTHFELRPHQEEAIENWRNNDFKGIFDIATAGGKTFTAIQASELSPKNVITVITVPTKPLQAQWIEEIKTHSPSSDIIVAGGDSHRSWPETLSALLTSRRIANQSTKDKISKRTVVIVTNATASSDKFLNLWGNSDPSDTQLIADEVHRLGSRTGQKIFDLPCDRRIGLSATWERQWDPFGTQEIENFFGGVVFTYTLAQGIRDGFLSHYEVHHIDVELTDQEYNEYHRLTREYGKWYAIQQQELKKRNETAAGRAAGQLKRIAQDRADIIKSAEGKTTAFESIIQQIPSEQKTIVFCTDSEQLDSCSNILSENSKTSRIYSTVSGLSKEQLSTHIAEFNGTDAKYLVGINCLNEGIDIATCTTCILMSSSGEPREYVQRRGRVLRLGGGSDVAHIYDIITYPPQHARTLDDHRTTIDALLTHELRRSDIMCEAADNRADIERELGPKFTSCGTTLSDIRRRIHHP
jgi:superfamily II DNA or RNA helicase